MIALVSVTMKESKLLKSVTNSACGGLVGVHGGSNFGKGQRLPSICDYFESAEAFCQRMDEDAGFSFSSVSHSATM